ncbi:MAG: TIR domain-containing protein [bacterium]|nr:TIR domain-containing protein [bacterium]
MTHTPPEKNVFDEIEYLLARNEILKAIERLQALPDYRREAILFSKRWHDIQKRERQQLLSSEDVVVEQNKLASAILKLREHAEDAPHDSKAAGMPEPASEPGRSAQAERGYFEHAGGNVYNAPVTIVQQETASPKSPKRSPRQEANDSDETQQQVFLCYAGEDREFAQQLYQDLQQQGVQPWMAYEDILPGQNWEHEIQQALKQSAYVLTLISSHSINKRGYVRKEIKQALDTLDKFSPGQVYLIPVRLDDSKPIDERLRKIHWVDLWPSSSYEKGLQRILQVLELHQKDRSQSRQDHVEPVEDSEHKEPETIIQQGSKKLPSSSKTEQTSQTTEPKQQKFEEPPLVPSPEPDPPPLLPSLKWVYRGLLIVLLFLGGGGAVFLWFVYQDPEPPPVEVVESPDDVVKKRTDVMTLRSDPKTVSSEEAQEVFDLVDRKFDWGTGWVPQQYTDNQFESQGEVVMDRATGLMWQQSGSKSYMNHADALKYVEELNRQKFAGYADWRLPTIPELVSLLEPEQHSNGLYIDPIFDKEQWWCWSSDSIRIKGEGSAGSAWSVYFLYGSVDWHDVEYSSYVRCVRS